MDQWGRSSTGPLPSMGRPSGSEHAAQRAFAHRGVQAMAGGGDHHALAKTFAGEHDAAHRRLVDVLRTSMVRSVPSAVTVSASCRAGSLPR